MKSLTKSLFQMIFLSVSVLDLCYCQLRVSEPFESPASRYIEVGYNVLSSSLNLPGDDLLPSDPTYFRLRIFSRSGDYGSLQNIVATLSGMGYQTLSAGSLFHLGTLSPITNSASIEILVDGRQSQFNYVGVSYMAIFSNFMLYVSYHIDTASFANTGVVTTQIDQQFPFSTSLSDPSSEYTYVLFLSVISILSLGSNFGLDIFPSAHNQTHFAITLEPTSIDYQAISINLLTFKTSQMVPGGLIYSSLLGSQLLGSPSEYQSVAYSNYKADKTFFGLQRLRYSTTGSSLYPIINDQTLRVQYISGILQLQLNILNLDQFQCDGGFFERSDFRTCQQCPDNCLLCSGETICQTCQHTFTLTTHSLTNITCECSQTELTKVCSDFSLTDPKYGCLFAYIDPSDNVSVKCRDCDQSLYLEADADGHCQCQSGYQQQSAGVCVEKCGDGVIKQAECDDGNLNDGDGCSSTCQLEAGFSCSVDSNGSTFCKGDQVLALEVISVIKSRNNSALFTYQTTDKVLPFDLEYSQFTALTSTKMFNFSITVGSEVIPLLDVHIMAVQGLQITFLMNYDFTMESFDLSLSLNTSQTRYNTESLSLTETVRGSEDPVIYSDYWDSYESISTGMLVLNCLVVTALFVGIFAPKFIGLETALVLQVIYFSQIMVLDTQDWPAGFMYLENLKYSTGYNQFFDFTSYAPIDSRSRKLNKISMEKGIVQNFSVSGTILILTFMAFMITQIVRSNSFENLVQFVAKKNKQKSPDVKKQQSRERALLIKKYTDYCEVNLKAFNALTQISLWVLLQILAAFSANSDIANSIVVVLQSSSVTLFLKIGSSLLMISLTLSLVVFFNFIKNILLSPQTIGKLSERPFQHNYKLMTFVYVLVMGFFIFFLREFQINTGSVTISSSMVALVTHCMYFGYILKINPYQVSLNIHKIGLIINQIVLLVFLVYLNMINLIDSFPEVIDLAMGFFLALCCAGLVVLSLVRLYYEYRYGEALEREVQEQREKEKRQAEAKAKAEFQMAVKYFEQEAKAKLTKDQKIRSENPFLIENQLKEDLMSDLLDWLQTRTIWTNEMKEKYYFARFERKPLKWLKINDPPKYAQHMAQVQKKRQEYLIKRQKKLEDPEYIELKNRLKGELKEFKKKAIS